MKVNVWNTIVQLSKERGVETNVIVNAIEESLKVASTKYFTHNEKINISFLPEKGELRVYTSKKISKNPENLATEISLEDAKEINGSKKIGNNIEIDLPSDMLGRIAAQAAKQVIFQKVRDAEQEKIYGIFAPQLGQIVTGVLRRFEPNENMILEVNKTEVLLPSREKLMNEEFKIGDRVKAVIIQVLKENKGPQVIVSRVDAKFLAKLLELETPEIANGNIEIRDIVRQPGERAKVAVLTKEKDIDPIGACIGVKGNRIMAISQELQGEKIDIIEWFEDPISYAKTALSPAKVGKAFILNRKDNIMQAVVSNDQLSLAIGKKGINVRLASRLIGWKIEIKEEQRQKGLI
jgi:N utilization substance protein A